MASQGPNFPTAATGNTNAIGGGSVAWVGPTNIEASGGGSANNTGPGAAYVTDDLIGTGFGFSIPAGATINGILLEVNYAATQSISGANEHNVRLLKAGSAAGSDKSTGTALPSTLTGFVIASYGGSADLWGTTWTPSDINNANFGAATNYSGFADTTEVDFFRITVFFTPPPPTARASVSALFGF
jgi:large repetitive protein